MRRFLPLLAALSFLLLPAVGLAQPAAKNVVIIIADDLGRDLGCYGNKVINTPHLDGLAKRGVRFANGYATVASCSPSRASIFTGLYTHQSGQYGLQHGPHAQQTHAWVQSLPNLLRLAGYYTGIIGKFHVGPDSVYNFEAVVSKATGGNRDPKAMAQRAREFVGQAGKRPFFLVVGFADPHRAKQGFGNEPFSKNSEEVRYDPKDVLVPPHLPDQPEVRKDLAEYYQSVSRLDRGVGEVLEALREDGQLDSTLIIFVSDNGIPFPGAKTTLYEAGLHLPFLIAGPGVPAGRTNNALVSWVDIAPTVLDHAGAKGPKYQLPGRSLLPILADDNPKGFDTVYASHQFHEVTMYYPMRSVITPRYKLIVNLAPEREFPFASDLWGSPSWQGIRSRKDAMMGKLSVKAYLHRPKEELFDLTKDPHELTNLAAEPAHAEALTNLRQRLRAWQRDTSDPWAILYREEDAKYNR